MPTLADLAQGPERVFPTHARIERYYPAAASEEARRLLTRCLERGEGPALLIGSPGTGKSMLMQVLADELAKQYTVACLTSAQLCTRRALLQSILFELGQPYRQRDEGDLRLTLIDFLQTSEAGARGVVLLVDEAQSLPTSLLEELRVLGNLSHRGEPQVRLLLAGSQPLDEKFMSPELDAFNQRVVARCYLAPLSHHDTAQYIRGHLAAAGGSPDELFSADAFDAMYNATGGIARLVNQVGDRALLLAASHGVMKINKDVVQGAWSDLQQLPTPWNLPDTPAGLADEEESDSDQEDNSAIVEFGPLSDDNSSFEVGVFAGLQESDADETDVQLANNCSAARELSSARMFEPADDDTEIDATENSPAAVSIIEAAQPNCSAGKAARQVSQPSEVDGLFGEGFEEEEVVIDEYAPLDAAMQRDRPRVTNSRESEISSLLHRVMRDEPQPAPVATEANLVDEVSEESFVSLSVVDQEEPDDEAIIDPTELDDEYPETEFTTSGQAAPVEHRYFDSDETSEEYLGQADVLLIDDEPRSSIHSAAAHRADYRQLFSSLHRE